MKKYFIILVTTVIAILVVLILMMFDCKKTNSLFNGLEPKAVFNEYKIYDIIEQRGLMCAEALEILYEDEEYMYYFNCLKSGQIYLVSTNETILVNHAYKAGIITKEELFELDIIDRMEK